MNAAELAGNGRHVLVEFVFEAFLALTTDDHTGVVIWLIDEIPLAQHFNRKVYIRGVSSLDPHRQQRGPHRRRYATTDKVVLRKDMPFTDFPLDKPIDEYALRPNAKTAQSWNLVDSLHAPVHQH